MSIATPSAKSHERVTGRWVRDFEVSSRKDWFVYYCKSVIGTPVPWLFCAYAILTFVSRAGLEIAAWLTAILSLLYISVDRLGGSREFKFFRLGCDFFLLGFAIVGVISAIKAPLTAQAIATLGDLRWVLLLYAITYTWELFPGLNRIFSLMVAASTVSAAYGIWQHFTGVDLVRIGDLISAPTPGSVYFLSTSFFSTPEILGTLLAMTLPFPAAFFMMSDAKEGRLQRWLVLGICLVLALSLIWTYRPGLWVAGLVGVMIAAIMQAKHLLTFLTTMVVFVSAVFFISYPSVDKVLTAVQENELSRSNDQRAQINTQVQLWQRDQQSLWIGVGNEATAAADYNPGTGNVYFHLLAQTGLLGVGFYFLFVLGFLLSTYRIYREIPSTHVWHRVLISGALASQIAFHVAGLYWVTSMESLTMNLFILVVSAVSYFTEHYSRGLVPDDYAL